MPVRFADLLEAFEVAGTANSFGEYRAFLCRETGKIYGHSDFEEFAELNDDLPDDVEDDEKYAAIPDKRALDLGKPLVLDFARQHLPNDFDDVRDIFSKRGAYPKFKALLARRHALDQWYDFEKKATERALRDWCDVNSIAVTD